MGQAAEDAFDEAKELIDAAKKRKNIQLYPAGESCRNFLSENIKNINILQTNNSFFKMIKV